MAFVISDNFKAFINTAFLLLLCFFFTSQIRSPSLPFNPTTLKGSPKGSILLSDHGASCIALQKLQNPSSKCLYLKTHIPCVTQGYINYLHIFYCICGSYPFIGYTLLTLWLLVLFYLLGNTASRYFCSSVESLSRELRLSPTIAGVTLLSLGNGSPDVFSSIVSFQSGSGEVGLSSVLGGAFFVSCVVVGIINICGVNVTARSSCLIDRASFVRDVCFFVIVLSSLLVILIIGKINILGAIAFTSLYFVYVSIVSATHFFGDDKYEDLAMPMLDQLNKPVASPKDFEESACQEDDSSTYLRWKSLISYYLRWFL